MAENPAIFQPSGPVQPQQPFRLYAAMCLWHESDIIEATVKNLFAEGCERVFFVDNDSPDDTVARAVAAGAEHHSSFSTDKFSEDLKTQSVMDLVADIGARDESDRIWWLLVDADEFPTGPHDLTVRRYLEGLDDHIRCVGSLWLQHMPAYAPFYLSGFHPAEFQPEANVWHLRAFPYCEQDHAKHNLLRHDRGHPFIQSKGGFHNFRCDETLFEPRSNLWLHHFQWRDPEFSIRRITAFTQPDANMESRVGGRQFYENIQNGHEEHFSFYVERAKMAEKMYDRDNYPEIHATHPLAFWQEVLDTDPGKICTISTWYAEGQLLEAVARAVPELEFLNWRCMYLAANRRPEELLSLFMKHRAAVPFRENVYRYVFEALITAGQGNEALSLLTEMLGRYPNSQYAKNALVLMRSRISSR